MAGINVRAELLKCIEEQHPNFHRSNSSPVVEDNFSNEPVENREFESITEIQDFINNHTSNKNIHKILNPFDVGFDEALERYRHYLTMYQNLTQTQEEPYFLLEQVY